MKGHRRFRCLLFILCIQLPKTTSQPPGSGLPKGPDTFASAEIFQKVTTEVREGRMAPCPLGGPKLSELSAEHMQALFLPSSPKQELPWT